MKDEPLFSVLIANYNNGNYLQEAVDSVKQQTYNNLEIILVDDGSTDNSQEIYKQYADDNRIKVFYNDKNHGCGYTKRRCVELANGELCGFLDSDDMILPNALKCMVELHQLHTDCSLIYSKLNGYRNGQIEEDELSNKMYKDTDDLLLAKSWMVSHFATFKRKSYNLTVGINPSLKLAVDTDLYYLLEEVGELFFYPHSFYLYRKDNSNSICEGSNGIRAYYYRAISSMNAIIRRKNSKNALFVKNPIEYQSVFRYWLSYYLKHVNQNANIFYIFQYLRVCGYSFNSIKHLIKMTKFYSFLKK